MMIRLVVHSNNKHRSHCFVFFDVSQRDDAFPLRGFQHPIALNPFGLDLVGAFTIPQGHNNLSLLVFLCDLQLPWGSRAFTVMR